MDQEEGRQMKYTIEFKDLPDGRVCAYSEEAGVEVIRKNRIEAQRDVAIALTKKIQKEEGRSEEGEVTFTLQKNEVEAIRTVLRLVLDGKLDAILDDMKEGE